MRNEYVITSVNGADHWTGTRWSPCVTAAQKFATREAAQAHLEGEMGDRWLARLLRGATIQNTKLIVNNNQLRWSWPEAA